MPLSLRGPWLRWLLVRDWYLRLLRCKLSLLPLPLPINVGVYMYVSPSPPSYLLLSHPSYGGRLVRDSHRAMQLARAGGGYVRAVLVELTQIPETDPASPAGGAAAGTVKYLTVVVPSSDGVKGFIVEFAGNGEQTLVLARVFEVVMQSFVVM